MKAAAIAVFSISMCFACQRAKKSDSSVHVGPDGVRVNGPAGKVEVINVEGEHRSGAAGGGDSWSCSAGECVSTCAADKTCKGKCSGGRCKFTCEKGATCDFGCSGGGCTQDCQPGSTCTLSCSGGHCVQRCDSCSKSCSGGGCT